MTERVSLGELRVLTDELRSDLTAYWNGLSEAISRSSDVIGGTASASADDYARFANEMLDLATNYANGLMNLAEGGGTSAERQMLAETGSQMIDSIESIRNSGIENLAHRGEATQLWTGLTNAIERSSGILERGAQIVPRSGLLAGSLERAQVYRTAVEPASNRCLRCPS